MYIYTYAKNREYLRIPIVYIRRDYTVYDSPGNMPADHGGASARIVEFRHRPAGVEVLGIVVVGMQIDMGAKAIKASNYSFILGVLFGD
jgi:hypothetical protein